MDKTSAVGARMSAMLMIFNKNSMSSSGIAAKKISILQLKLDEDGSNGQ